MPTIPGVNSASPPAAGVSTRAGQVSYYASILGELPGTYQGNQKAYDGLTWPAFYRKLAAQHPSDDPKQLADTVLGIADLQGVATNAIGPTITATGNFATTTAKAANAFTNDLPKVSNPLTGWTHNIEQWVIRGFEMLLGIGLIIVAVAKLASDTPAGRAAIKAGKAAMIL